MTKDRAGTFIPNLSGDSTYYSFKPNPLPPEPPIQLDDDLLNLVVEAHRLLAVLDDRATHLPDMDLFISMYVQKEALLSSQIEGTQATLEDLFHSEIDKHINEDVSQVVNYVQATHYVIDQLSKLPLCNRLLLNTHKVLLSDVRGKEKNPGEFRRSQNWIGGTGSSLKTARYIPPNVEDMTMSLHQLEDYLNTQNGYDPLIKAALVHYQFETIHPFLDGNGRIGRLLIILYLLEQEVIQTPALYLSYYLKQNRVEYYDRMTAVRETGDFEQWVRFFIQGTVISARSCIETADRLIQLKEEAIQLIKNQDFTPRSLETVVELYHYLLTHPVVNITHTAEAMGVAYNTANTAIQRLCDLDILKNISTQRRSKVFAYQDYLDILNEGAEIEGV